MCKFIDNIRNYTVSNPPIFLLKNITPNSVITQFQNLIKNEMDVKIEIKNEKNKTDNFNYIEMEC